MIIDRFLPNVLESAPWQRCMSELGENIGRWIEENLFAPFLNQVIVSVESVLEIDPGLREHEILQEITALMVKILDAQSGSVRIFDPNTGKLLSYGSYPLEEAVREKYVPVVGTIAGEVLKTKRPYIVKDLLSEERFQHKEIAFRKGAFSLLAVPFEIPKFYPSERETFGVIQLYFKERNRDFSKLEIVIADLIAKRLSFVIARRKIHILQKAREKREAVSQIIIKASKMRGGLKLKEIFAELVSNLKDVLDIEMSVLLSTDDNMQKVIVEAAYPDSNWAYQVGESYPIATDAAIQILLDLQRYQGQSSSEIVTPWYVLITDPETSEIINSNTKDFAIQNGINSILYIPLQTDFQNPNFLVFAAKEQRKRYTDDEIDILLYVGRELVKVQRMERLDDALHDFKNPAIAIAGFARRLERVVATDPLGNKEQILKYARILSNETSRLQELALSIYQVGKEEWVSLTEVLRERFEINREAIEQQLRQNISLKEGPFDDTLKVLCYRINLERVFDNVLNNATKAIPIEGGTLAIKTFREGDWACAQITNSGEIPPEMIGSLKEGYASGRGLYITNRIVKMMNGKMEIESKDGVTSFTFKFPGPRAEGGNTLP